ncbi:MAG: hypothetical protein KatS3mg059_1384 [Thermomicrobiales bacterium]|nr:MAG: hypothetical protein KatS3mg059_1384 [Thermomicrobiales bacterium]
MLERPAEAPPEARRVRPYGLATNIGNNPVLVRSRAPALWVGALPPDQARAAHSPPRHSPAGGRHGRKRFLASLRMTHDVQHQRSQCIRTHGRKRFLAPLGMTRVAALGMTGEAAAPTGQGQGDTHPPKRSADSSLLHAAVPIVARCRSRHPERSEGSRRVRVKQSRSSGPHPALSRDGLATPGEIPRLRLGMTQGGWARNDGELPAQREGTWRCGSGGDTASVIPFA